MPPYAITIIIVLTIVAIKLKIRKKRDSKIKKRKRMRLCAIIKYKSNAKEAHEKKKRIIERATKTRRMRI